MFANARSADDSAVFRDGLQHKNTIVPGSTAALPAATPSLPELSFKAHSPSNVTSVLIGKWHLGYASFNNTPIGRGFDQYVGYMQGQVDYFNKTVAVGYGKGYDFWNGDALDRSAAGKYSLLQYEAAWGKAIRQFSLNGQQQQLYLCLAFQTVHIPIEAAGEDGRCAHIADYWRRVYCSMIVELDDAAGRLADMLTDAVGESFAILAMSDNGAQVRWATYGGNKTHNKPFWPASTGDNRPLLRVQVYTVRGWCPCHRLCVQSQRNFCPQDKAKHDFHGGLMHACDFAATALALGGVT